jgi:hypothetical protein
MRVRPAANLRLDTKSNVRNRIAAVHSEPHAAPSVFEPYKRGTHRAGQRASCVSARARSGSDIPMKNVGQSVTPKMIAAVVARPGTQSPSLTYSMS